MTESRIIPVLTMDRRRRLVKTVGFGDRTYVGDPFNVVRLFNEKEVDELCLLDIDATVDAREPDIDFIAKLASECFMPLAYGGGISTIAQCERLNRCGVEKFVIGSGSVDLEFLRALARDFGSQAVVACMDVRTQGGARCVVRSGSAEVDRSPRQFALELQEAGVGELIVQAVERDGTRCGYDLALIRDISSMLSVPVVALGGAGRVPDLVQALLSGASAAASGSAFTFIGRLRAVLISYPSAQEIARCMAESR